MHAPFWRRHALHREIAPQALTEEAAVHAECHQTAIQLFTRA